MRVPVVRIRIVKQNDIFVLFMQKGLLQRQRVQCHWP